MILGHILVGHRTLTSGLYNKDTLTVNCKSRNFGELFLDIG
jgi:hypothetical protein